MFPAILPAMSSLISFASSMGGAISSTLSKLVPLIDKGIEIINKVANVAQVVMTVQLRCWKGKERAFR